MPGYTQEVNLGTDGVLNIAIGGVFDETVNLDGMISGKEFSEIRFNFSAVKRINSSGVRKWLLFLQNHKGQLKISLDAAPPCVVEQMNLIAGFLDGVMVRSIFLPYVCTQCDHEHMELIESAEFAKLKTELPVMTCSSCNHPNMEFDYLPEEYLYFLSQSVM